jgi:hypothetical protein
MSRAPFELVGRDEIDKASQIFHRDGFVAVADALSAEQLALAR